MKFEPVLFRHTLMDNLPSAPSKERIIELLDRLIIGDKVAKEILIKHLLLVAKRCVGTILAVYPGNKNELDDMVSESTLVVVDLVDRLAKGLIVDPVKLMNYVAVAVLQ